MKKLKLKVIEAGRILNPTELNHLKGGFSCSVHLYSSCDDSGYTTCSDGYGERPCLSLVSCNGYASCSTDPVGRSSCEDYEFAY